ncbi:thiamine/thiamine pyrophosphate ABC transporter permease [uncultured Cocleimonas sp.]|uniref:thiamine/thiamine pyrophosphate ABC transporter permease n=1 Tax=uncultured Cocleimonas sp. TaxID=1051587 RepID=UPI00263610AD|nr:thiamine/thiamine pyrophosphate ABC transporter permease [uncultured Cocleimonas sp.]
MKAGIFVALFVIAFITVPLFSLFLASGTLSGEQTASLSEIWNSSYIRRVLFFSLWQAFLSTLLSITLAIIVSRAFARYPNFPFRSFFLSLFGLPLIVPAVVAVIGIITVYGKSGWLPIGSNLYGLFGILLAHVFFNLPLAVRLFVPVWNQIPEQHWRIASQLKFNSTQQWKHIEWPALRESLPSVALLIFMLCLTSFAVVLTLGGGPKSTTVEVAIYQSLRFDFDPAQAVVLALLQLGLSILVAIIASRFNKIPDVEPDLNIKNAKHQSETGKLDKILQITFIVFAILFVSTPLLAIFIDAARGPIISVLSERNLWMATAFSLVIGLSAATISLILSWFLLNASARASYQNKSNLSQWLLLSGSIIFVVPPLVIGTGLFILLADFINVFDWAILIVILINGLLGIPFIIRTLGPEIRQNTMKYQRLCDSLNLKGWQRFKHLDFPLLRKPLGLSAALVTVFTMGDLGIIALFGSPETATLPLLLYQRLGAYQIPQAAVTAAFLLLISLITFWLLEKIIGGKTQRDL